MRENSEVVIIYPDGIWSPRNFGQNDLPGLFFCLNHSASLFPRLVEVDFRFSAFLIFVILCVLTFHLPFPMECAWDHLSMSIENHWSHNKREKCCCEPCESVRSINCVSTLIRSLASSPTGATGCRYLSRETLGPCCSSGNLFQRKCLICIFCSQKTIHFCG